MDIEKEREVFEAIAENIRLLRGAKFKDGEYVALSLFDESSKELAARLNYGWSMWLSAKAQAIPEGFVLVPKEPTPKMIDATWNYDDEIQDMSHNTRNEFIYKAMIEAQEQAND